MTAFTHEEQLPALIELIDRAPLEDIGKICSLSPYTRMICQTDPEIRRLILRKRVDRFLTRDFNVPTPIAHAITEGYEVDFINELIRRNPQWNAEDYHVVEILDRAIGSHRTDVLDLLFQQGLTSEQYESAIRAAMSGFDFGMVNYLLTKKDLFSDLSKANIVETIRVYLDNYRFKENDSSDVTINLNFIDPRGRPFSRSVPLSFLLMYSRTIADQLGDLRCVEDIDVPIPCSVPIADAIVRSIIEQGRIVLGLKKPVPVSRPVSAFDIFSQEKRAAVRASFQNEAVPASEVSMRLGEMWNGLDAGTRMSYTNRADAKNKPPQPKFYEAITSLRDYQTFVQVLDFLGLLLEFGGE